MYLKAMMLFFIIAGCNENTIKGNDRRLPAAAASASAPEVYVDSVQKHAAKDREGSATLVVKAGQPIQVKCVDCPIPLSFSADVGGAVYRAEFEHQIVTKTMLCKVRLEVDYDAEGIATKTIDYGLYFCPDRTDGSIDNRNRSCGDLSLATNGCPR